MDIRQSPQYANYLSKIGWTVERINETNYFIKKIPLIGSVLKIQKPEEIHLDTIRKLAKKHRAFQIIVEPNLTSADTAVHNLFIAQGFHLSKSPYLPTKTLQLDLTQTKEEIFNQMKKDTRSTLRTTNNLKLSTNNDIENFREGWKKAVGWKRYVPPTPHLIALKEAFADETLFLSTENGSAGGIFLKTKDTGYYWQAFTNKKGRKQGAQYRIVWEGILWAKRNGAKIFDFEGIHDERFPNKSWLGFTHFKKSFGGKEVEFPGCFIKNALFL